MCAPGALLRDAGAKAHHTSWPAGAQLGFWSSEAKKCLPPLPSSSCADVASSHIQSLEPCVGTCPADSVLLLGAGGCLQPQTPAGPLVPDS